MKPKTLFALDFDGVICDSAIETAITGWKVAQEIWPDMQDQLITNEHIKQFRKIRPCLEVGFEAILIMRLLQQGIKMGDSCNNYHQQTLMDKGLNPKDLQVRFGETRDREIQQDEAGWIASNPIFDSIAKKLRTLKQEDWIIVTTKQERFLKRILQGNGISLDESRIYGLDRKLDKQTVLKILITQHPNRPVTFIEDRLPTLEGVLKNPELQNIKVQLVDWGYNTAAERTKALEKGIEVIGADEFFQDSFRE
jgi:phosphoglycolate phosphatase-like HAD superfamily hydrolase